VSHQIVSKRPFLRNLTHEHRDRAPDCLIDIDDENFIAIADKNCAPTAGRQNRAHLHFDHRLVHPGERYPETQEKQATCQARPLKREIFLKRACMFHALIENAICDRRSRHEAK
jgi:hypothetical protein